MPMPLTSPLIKVIFSAKPIRCIRQCWRMGSGLRKTWRLSRCTKINSARYALRMKSALSRRTPSTKSITMVIELRRYMTVIRLSSRGCAGTEYASRVLFVFSKTESTVPMVSSRNSTAALTPTARRQSPMRTSSSSSSIRKRLRRWRA